MTVLVNNYYPVRYFTDQNLPIIAGSTPTEFWASDEKLAPAADEIILDLGNIRPCNFLDFEIAAKPIDIAVYAELAGEWVLVEDSELFEGSKSVTYLPSIENPWTYFEYYFKVVQTRKLKIVFIRRTNAFPFLESPAIPFSIEVRNLRAMHVISALTDFIEDTGTDILGNTYRTDLTEYPAANVLDGNPLTFWQSQPNPSRFAVECLYFDLRLGQVDGTMEYLNTQFQDDLNTRSMSDMAEYHEDGTVIDEIFIDPITLGPFMHVYTSVDDTPEWDDKLWTPIARHYIVQRGYHTLPRPTFVKYVKLEFSHLTAAPYNTADYPAMPPVEYRRYPTWVQNYFNNLYILRPNSEDFIDPIERVEIDPLTFGFVTEDDRFDTEPAPPTVQQTEAEITGFIQGLVAAEDLALEPQEQIESEIEFNSPFMWQGDLIARLNSRFALSRVAQQGNTGWASEQPPITLEPPTTQSVPDLTQAKKEKEYPIMWFPIRTRHQYQIVRSDRLDKLAFFVSIREVSFHRRNYTVTFDEPFYSEIIGDDQNVESTTFEHDEWRYVIDE